MMYVLRSNAPTGHICLGLWLKDEHVELNISAELYRMVAAVAE
jgi:hypothetical protein